MKGVLAAVVVAIVIAIAGVAVVAAVQAAVLEEVTVVATPAVVAADAEDGRKSSELTATRGAAAMRPFFYAFRFVAAFGNSRVAPEHSCPRALARRVGV